MSDLTLIGETVRNERLARSLSMETAAAKAEVSVATWRRVERGRSVRQLTMVRVLRFLGLDAAATTASAAVVSQATVLGDLVGASVRAGRMRVIAGFGGVQ